MRKYPLHFMAAAALALTLAAPVAHAQSAKAAMKDKDGKDVGTVELTETPNGVLLKATLTGLPPGTHAFHIHGVGQCEPPFTSAKGHFNPEEKKHGFLAEGGPHAGDMPNIHVPESGELSFEVFNTAITLEKGDSDSVFDDDGSTVMIHEGADDYKTDPAGDAGARIACGVIE